MYTPLRPGDRLLVFCHYVSAELYCCMTKPSLESVASYVGYGFYLVGGFPVPLVSGSRGPVPSPFLAAGDVQHAFLPARPAPPSLSGPWRLGLVWFHYGFRFF